MVAIKNMEMPTSCCEFHKDTNLVIHCPLYNSCDKRTTVKVNFKPIDCPLVEIVTCEDEDQKSSYNSNRNFYCSEESSCNNSKNVSQYRIRKFMHSRVMNETKITDEGYVNKIIIGEEGLEEFAKAKNASIVERDNNGHIIRCSQKEYTMSGGFEGCFFEFVPEEIFS